jgi:hypothetical protein
VYEKRVADIEEIRSLSYRYVLGLDTNSAEDAVRPFTPDVIFDPTTMGLPLVTGRQNLLEFFRREIDGMAAQAHLSTNHIVEFVSHDEAVGSNYLLAEGITKEATGLRVLLLNRDRYVRAAMGWQIAHRTLQPLTPPQLGALSL